MSRSLLFIMVTFALLGLSVPVTAWDYTILASVATDGTQGNGVSYEPSISANGRYVAFHSDATTLVTGDTNARRDVFVHNRVTGQTSRVSVSSNGTQGNDGSDNPSISEDGRYIAFISDATNLVAGDTNGKEDIFVRDRGTGQTSRVSVSSNGTQGNGNSNSPTISEDGRYVAFDSYATNLIAGDTNGKGDIFVHDRVTGWTIRVSVSTAGTQGNGDSLTATISGDGRYVAFASDATNLVTGDTNGKRDIFVHDRVAGWTIRVSFPSAGGEADASSCFPSISGDGRYVSYWSYATNLVAGDTNEVEDVFLYDRNTAQTTRVSVSSSGTQGNDFSGYPSISGDGRLIAFYSSATNLVTGDTNSMNDVFMHDRVTGTTTRVSVATGGAQGNHGSAIPSISGSGQHIAFHSGSTNLVPGDTNNYYDIFVHSYPLRYFAVFRPSASNNWIYSTNLASVTARNHYGAGTDTPLVGDLNDDGVVDRAVFRNGEWIIDYSMDGSVNWRPNYGMAGDIPLTGYFNSDGFTDRAVYRNGQWILDYWMDGTVDSRTWYGMAGDIPLIGDFNNDGTSDRAVFRASAWDNWIIDYNRDGTVDVRNHYGSAGDIPLIGDFNGDGVMDRAVFRNGEWIIDYNMDGSVNWRADYGMAGDIPLMWWQV